MVAGGLHPARNWARWFLHNSLLLEQLCLVKPWPGHPDQIWVNCVQYDPCLLWKNNWNGCCMLAIMAITKMLLDWICHVYWEDLLTFYPYHWLHKHSNSQYHWLQKTFKLPADYSHKVAQQVTQSLHSCLLCIWVHNHVLIINCTATSDWLKMSIKKKICTKLCEYKWNWQCELTLPEDPHCRSAGSGWWHAACGLKRTVHCAATPCNTGKLLLSHQVVVLDAPFARQIDLRILLCQSQYAF